MNRSPQLLPSRLLFLLVALASVFLLLSARVDAGEPVAVTDTIVMPGDTLWSIAASVTDEGDDIRRTVSDLRRINHLETSDLQVGQHLQVPTG